MSLLQTTGLTRHFGGLTAVNNVNFVLNKGEVRALIGPNGAGKSTFIGLLCGRMPPSDGRVEFDGQDVTGLPAHKRISRGMAYTFQITSIFGGLTAHENVALAARQARRLHGGELADAVAAALAEVGIADRAEDVAGDLSYGHQRLLEIAMGLVQSPRLLILDEPTQGLAESEIAVFKALIRRLAGDMTILLVEHNMSVVMETADRISVLNFGAMLAEGTPAEIQANPAVQAAYLGTG